MRCGFFAFAFFLFFSCLPSHFIFSGPSSALFYFVLVQGLLFFFCSFSLSHSFHCVHRSLGLYDAHESFSHFALSLFHIEPEVQLVAVWVLLEIKH